LLGIARSSLYYQKRAVSEFELKLMERIDQIFTDCPFYGSRKISRQLRTEGLIVNRKRVRRLMRIMGIEAIYPKPNLSFNGKEHLVIPYLLKGLIINRPNQVWGIDITYIKLKGGFVYLVAVIDWYSRLVISWEVSISLDKQFVIDCVKKAFETAIPEILNSDQGVQMTSKEYVEVVETSGVKISMDHKGRCFDNIFTERLWRTVKYEEVYLKEYSGVKDAVVNLTEYFKFYNQKRLHQSLNYLTPQQVHDGMVEAEKTEREEVNKSILKIAF
jgi:putative transposase